ncbi:MAG TPA: NAD(P)H-dependent oxidoreductase [Rhizomicrobium sp.]|nr:NAD(P)H-dependent oxidoreductase [Rhizomicrobium sp.]
MKHAVILAHPKSDSFTATMAASYCEAAESHGVQIALRDLYRTGFDPCLRADEIPWSADFTTHADVAAERAILRDADVFALFYPLWLNAPPAILKGYLERVFGMGFGYGRSRGGTEPLLSGRKLISFTSSGAPMDWVVQTGAWQAIRVLFDSHFASVCGMDVADHVHFGNVVPGIRPDFVTKCAVTVREKAASLLPVPA